MIWKAIILIILQPFIQSSDSSSLIKIPIVYVYLAPCSVSFILGESYTIHYAPLNLNSSATWIYNREYNKKASLSEIILNEDTIVSYQEYNLTAIEIRNQFAFSYHPLKKITLDHYKTSLGVKALQGSIGLGYSFKDNRYSIIHEYHRNGHINHLSFSLIMQKEESKRHLYLGGIPDDYTINKNHSSINVIGKGSQWDFNFDSVVIANDTKEIKYSKHTYACLNTIDDFIYVPSDFFDLLVNDFYKEKIDKKNCHVLNRDKENRYIISSIHSENRLGRISFTIGDYIHQFELNELWYCREEYCELSIRESPIKNTWILGYDFMEHFNILFDYEEKQIHLYPFRGKHIYQHNPIKSSSIVPKVSYIIIIVVLSLGSCLLLSQKLRHKLLLD